MKIVLLTAAICLAAAPASALFDTGINSLGVYFDSTGDVYCMAPSPFTPFNIYFILANPVSANLGGYEFAWRFLPAPATAPIIYAVVLPPGAVNIGVGGSFIVDLENGLITSEATILARVTMIALAPISPDTYIQVGPATPSSLPLRAATYASGHPGVYTPMDFVFCDVPDDLDDLGWVEPGVARMSGPCPPPQHVASEATTWSNLKVLFR
jgi:hypothetical protein